MEAKKDGERETRGMERSTGRRVSMFRAFRHMRRDDTDRKQSCPSHFAASVFAAPVCFGVSEHDAVKHVCVCVCMTNKAA